MTEEETQAKAEDVLQRAISMLEYAAARPGGAPHRARAQEVEEVLKWELAGERDNALAEPKELASEKD